MPKLCPTHQQPYVGGVCRMCEERAGGGVDWKAECRRLNERVARLEAELEQARRQPAQPAGGVRVLSGGRQYRDPDEIAKDLARAGKLRLPGDRGEADERD